MALLVYFIEQFLLVFIFLFLNVYNKNHRTVMFARLQGEREAQVRISIFTNTKTAQGPKNKTKKPG